MDNYYGNAPQRPRKRVTKKMLRYRQFGGIAVVGFVVLLIIVLIANACSSDGGKTKVDNTATTTTAAATTTAPPTTTTTATTTSPLNNQVKLSTRALFVGVGETDVAIINEYPTGSGEANEVWTSKDKTIAIVDELGYVTGVTPGETYIFLTFDNNPDVQIEIKVTVSDGGAGAAAATAATTTTTRASTTEGFPTVNAAAVSYTTVAEGFAEKENIA